VNLDFLIEVQVKIIVEEHKYSSHYSTSAFKRQLQKVNNFSVRIFIVIKFKSTNSSA